LFDTSGFAKFIDGFSLRTKHIVHLLHEILFRKYYDEINERSSSFFNIFCLGRLLLRLQEYILFTKERYIVFVNVFIMIVVLRGMEKYNFSNPCL